MASLKTSTVFLLLYLKYSTALYLSSLSSNTLLDAAEYFECVSKNIDKFWIGKKSCSGVTVLYYEIWWCSFKQKEQKGLFSFLLEEKRKGIYFIYLFKKLQEFSF